MTFEEWQRGCRIHCGNRMCDGECDECRSFWAESRKELLGLIDGALPIVELWNSAESPAQAKWQKDWIKKAREVLK